MDLVEDHRVRVEALLGECLGRQRAVCRGSRRHFEDVLVDLDDLLQLRLKLDHPLGRVEYDPSLLLVGSARVDLAAGRTKEHPSDSHARPETGLAVLASDADQCRAVTEPTVRPARIHVPQELALPLPDDEQLSGRPGNRVLRDPAYRADEVGIKLAVTSR